MKHFDEHFDFTSPSLARKTSHILHCAIHKNKHIWQSEKYNDWAKIRGARSYRKPQVPIPPSSNLVLQIVVTRYPPSPSLV